MTTFFGECLHLQRCLAEVQSILSMFAAKMSFSQIRLFHLISQATCVQSEQLKETHEHAVTLLFDMHIIVKPFVAMIYRDAHPRTIHVCLPFCARSDISLLACQVSRAAYLCVIECCTLHDYSLEEKRHLPFILYLLVDSRNTKLR